VLKHILNTFSLRSSKQQRTGSASWASSTLSRFNASVRGRVPTKLFTNASWPAQESDGSATGPAASLEEALCAGPFLWLRGISWVTKTMVFLSFSWIFRNSSWKDFPLMGSMARTAHPSALPEDLQPLRVLRRCAGPVHRSVRADIGERKGVRIEDSPVQELVTSLVNSLFAPAKQFRHGAMLSRTVM